MDKIKTIMVCVDLSPYSLEALEYGVALSKENDTKLIVFNVINQRDILGIEAVDIHSGFFVPATTSIEDYIAELKKRRLEEIETMLKERFAQDRHRMDIRIETGVPYNVILDAVEPLGADLVVMGNKGRGNLSRFLFGSVAEKVFRHCPVPVVSIRSNFNRE